MHRLTSASQSAANVPGHLRMTLALMLTLAWSVMVACGQVEYESPETHQHHDHPKGTKSADPNVLADNASQDQANHPSSHEAAADATQRAYQLSQVRSYTKPPKNKHIMSPSAWEESLVTAYTCAYSRKVVTDVFAKHYSAGTNGIVDQEAFTNEIIELILAEIDPNKVLFDQTSVNYLLDKYSAQLVADFIYAQSCEQLKLLKADIQALAGPQLAYMLNLLHQDHNFNEKEYVNLKGVGPQLTWPTSHNLAERQRKIAKFSFINHQKELKNHSADIYSAKAKLFISSLYKSKKHRLIYSSNERFYFEFTAAFIQALDYHSKLLTAYDGRQFDSELFDTYVGLGITLEHHQKYIFIRDIALDGAAYLDGRLKQGDYIAAIKDGELSNDNPWVSVQDISVRQFANIALGQPNTPVSLRVLTPIDEDSARRHSYELTLIRKEFTSQSFLNADGAYHIYQIDDPELASPVNVGYVVQKHFSHRSPGLIHDAIHDLIDQGANVILFDYRDNPGGLLDAGIEILNYFVKPPIGVWRSVMHSQRDGYPIPPELQISRLAATHTDVAPEVYDIPLIFLINNRSASSTEVITSSIKSHGRALIIGDERTHGKGTAQAVIRIYEPHRPESTQPRDQVGFIKLTTTKYYPPDGISIQIKGVTSDLVIPSYTSELTGYDIDHPYYRYHLQPDNITDVIPLDHLLGLGFRDESLIHKLGNIYKQRMSSEEYLTENQAWLNEEASPFNQKTAIYLDAKDDSITRQLYTAEYEARRDFLLEQPSESRKEAATKLRTADHMLDEALFIAAHYYQLCRLNADGSAPAGDYDKSAGCLTPQTLDDEAEVASPATLHPMMQTTITSPASDQ